MKAYSYQLREIDYKEEIDIENNTKTITNKYSKSWKKTTTELIKSFNKHIKNEKINILKFDCESIIKSSEFQQYSINHNIKFIHSIPCAYTSLSLIDRLCITIRNISFNINYELILTQNKINIIINYYNNTRHEILTKILKVIKNWICPNDLFNNSDL